MSTIEQLEKRKALVEDAQSEVSAYDDAHPDERAVKLDSLDELAMDLHQAWLDAIRVEARSA
ncbi:MAG TPA: hypothetical protein VIY73_24645 [Polyangiaceae bacterium]